MKWKAGHSTRTPYQGFISFCFCLGHDIEKKTAPLKLDSDEKPWKRIEADTQLARWGARSKHLFFFYRNPKITFEFMTHKGSRNKFHLTEQNINLVRKWFITSMMFMALLCQWTCYYQSSYYFSSQG